MSESDSNDEIPTSEQIADATDIVQSRRLNSIFDIRDELREHRKIILMEKYDNKGISRFQALSGYRTLANNYLMELQPLLKKFEPGQELLTERDFGTATIVPKYEITSSSRRGGSANVEIYHATGGTTKVAEEPTPQKLDLTGLESIWNIPDPLETRLTLDKFDNASRGTRPQPVRIQDQFSVNTTDRFVRAMNLFLSDIGFELEPQEDKEPYQI
jgi:hypothetical protein